MPSFSAKAWARPGLRLLARWIADFGLDCYEYQCGKGVHVGKETAVKIGEAPVQSAQLQHLV